MMTVVYNAHPMLLMLLLTFSSLLVKYLVLACDMDTVRRSAREQMPGGWSDVAADDDSVVQLKQSVANDAIVVRAHHVVESYQQVIVYHVTLMTRQQQSQYTILITRG